MDVQPKGISRRKFLAGSAALAAGALLAQKGWVAAQPFFGPEGVDVEGLERNGFLVRHTICHQCGAGCGLTALVRKNEPPSQENMFIFGNQHPEHPQRGMCGRGATAPYTWDSPLRLRKPLKRVGERGEGRFEEVTWDQALDEIGAKIREIIERDGARSLAFSTHDYANEQRLAAYALGAPNVISQASTCNTAGVVGRRWMMGSGFDHHATIDPDYDNVRYVLFPGRSLNAPIGAVHRLNKAREHGAKVVFLNPAHPDVAFANADWIPCVPGTDAAFMLGVAHVLVDEEKYDRSFVLHQTNLPFLIKDDGKPLTQQDLVEGGDANVFALMGTDGVLAMHTDAGLEPDLTYAGTATLADGTEAPVTTAWNRLVDHLADFTPGNAAQITGVPSDMITRVAHELFIMRGVVEDTWYNTRNGNDTDVILGLMTVNALLGNLDTVGGLGVRLGSKLPGIIGRASDGTVSLITGDSYVMEQTKRIDQELYPETNATFDAVFTGILEERPYPITGLILTGATIFHRDPNVARSIEAIKKLDLLVTIDILHQEICDWSDYVLPAEM
ncbi:MAG: molybdopterin-dependent oxidoreductase, partial [Trueperaceae bacterium]